MATLAIDDDLWSRIFTIYFLNAALQLQYHGTGGINNANAPFISHFVRSRWLTMRTQQHFRAFGQLVQFLVRNRLQPRLAQTLALATIMYNIAQAAE